MSQGRVELMMHENTTQGTHSEMISTQWSGLDAILQMLTELITIL